MHDAITVIVVDNDLLPHIGQRLRSCVGVRIALRIVDQGSVRHNLFPPVLANRGRPEADSLGRFGVEYDALDVCSLIGSSLAGS